MRFPHVSSKAHAVNVTRHSSGRLDRVTEGAERWSDFSVLKLPSSNFDKVQLKFFPFDAYGFGIIALETIT